MASGKMSSGQKSTGALYLRANGIRANSLRANVFRANVIEPVLTASEIKELNCCHYLDASLRLLQNFPGFQALLDV
jgi:hypothetical protein